MNNEIEAERIEIQAAYDFYRHHLNAGLKKYYAAFVQKENLFPDATKPKAPSSAKPAEFDADTIKLYHSIDKHDRNPQLEAGK